MLERARVIFAENSKIAEVVVHGGGSRGGPVASFTRTTSRHSSLQRQAPCAYPQSHAVGMDQCAIFRIVAIVIDYFHYLSLPVIDYLLIRPFQIEVLLQGTDRPEFFKLGVKNENHVI